MNLNRNLNPKLFIQRTYLSCRSGGRGLSSLESLHERIVLYTANRSLKNQNPLMRFITEHELQELISERLSFKQCKMQGLSLA